MAQLDSQDTHVQNNEKENIGSTEIYISIYTIICAILFSIIPIFTHIQPYLYPNITISPIIKTLIYVGCSGGLGGVLYSVLGFSKHYILGNFTLKYIWWYIYRPLTSVLLGIFVFCFVAGGLMGLSLQPNQAVPDITAGFAATTIMFYSALGFLVGYSSNHILLKLEDLADTIFPVSRPTPEKPAIPLFTVQREDGKIKIILQDIRGAKTVKGLRLIQPTIEKPDLAASDTCLTSSQAFTIPDPYSGSKGYFVATSLVNGNPHVVIDTII